ncbi:MAG: hypothetical protein ACI4UX_06095 [Clostridia bacterium]
MKKSTIIYIVSIIIAVIIISVGVCFAIINNKNKFATKNITIEKYNENNEIEKTVEIKNKNDVNKLFEICDKISLDQDETTKNLGIKTNIVVNLQNGLTLSLQEGLDDYCFYKTEDISCTIKTPEGLLDFVNNALKD